MGRDIRPPKRVKKDYMDLSEMQMLFLDCYVLQLTEPKMLFNLLLAPTKSGKDSNAMLRGLLKSSDGIAYMQERKKQLEQFYFGAEKDDEERPQRTEEDIRNIIYKKMSEDIVESIENGTLEYKQGDILTKFMNKALDYDDKEVNAPEPPRIYLPENCKNCRYKLACENPDNVIDECLFCKYRQDSIERGIEYDEKNQLNLKQE